MIRSAVSLTSSPSRTILSFALLINKKRCHTFEIWISLAIRLSIFPYMYWPFGFSLPRVTYSKVLSIFSSRLFLLHIVYSSSLSITGVNSLLVACIEIFSPVYNLSLALYMLSFNLLKFKHFMSIFPSIAFGFSVLFRKISSNLDGINILLIFLLKCFKYLNCFKSCLKLF